MSLQSKVLLSQYDNSIRTLFNSIFKYNLFDKLSIKALSDNIFFHEKETDILGITTRDDIENLIAQGYEETTYEQYTNTLINAMLRSEEVLEYSIREFNNIFYIDNTKIGIGFKGNIVNLTQHNPYELIASIEYDFQIKDFVIDSEGFVYILTEDKFIKSHVSLNFFKESNHSCITKFEDIEKLFSINVSDAQRIINIDDYHLYYLNSNKEVIKVTLGRKYYFIKDEQVFFNVICNIDKVTVQVEHTHFYDWISLLGLNSFSVNDKKLSTKYTKEFKDLLRFPFGSDLNGMLNYADFLNHKDYRIDLDINFIKVLGNFNYNFEKGKYKISLRVSKSLNDISAKFQMNLIKDNECLKSIYGNTVNNIAYFCNLKFIFYKAFYEDEVIEIYIDIQDDYTVKVINKYEYIDEKSLISDFDDLAKIDQFFRRDSIKHQVIETDFENGYFIIRDYIKNSKERNFGKDYGIRFIEKDGTPSILWRQIKDKDYFLSFKSFKVVKILKPKRSENKLLSCESKQFSLNLEKISGRKRRK